MKTLAFDVETSGLWPYHGCDMFSYATCDIEGNTEVYRETDKNYLKKLREIWSGKYELVMHNCKFDTTFTEKLLGQRLNHVTIHCTHKMSHILNNHHRSHGLEDLAHELAGYERIDKTVKRLAKKSGGFHKVPVEIMDHYQRMDVERTMLLHSFFWPMIQERCDWLEIYNTEIELVWATMPMEARGLMVHRGRTEKLIENLRGQVEQLREQLFLLAGWRFNPNSDDEIRKLLFKKLQLPMLKQTKTGKSSADKYVLMALKEQTGHPALDIIMKLRSYSRGITTLQSYIDLSDSDMILHTSINTCKAITSREATSHPNLQNVSKSEVLLNPYPIPARVAFRPRPGYVNLHVDYAGIEMRLLVHYSQDPRMIEEMNKPKGDPHALAALVFYGDRFLNAEGSLKKTLRSAAKNANFAIPYGASIVKVAQTLGIPFSEAKAVFKAYKNMFGPLVGLSKTISGQVEENGYIETAFGRRLHVPRSKGYIGTNYLIQGTAAGVLKRAQNRVHRYNVEETDNDVKLLLPIHDEIVIEYPRSRLNVLPDYMKDINELMIDFPQFDVPMGIEADITTASWEQKTPLRIPA